MPTSSLSKPPPSGGIRFITHCPCLLDFQESDFPRNGNIWADSVLCQSGRGGRGWRRNLLKQSRPIPALGRASPLTALLNFPPNLRFHREMTFPDKYFSFFFFLDWHLGQVKIRREFFFKLLLPFINCYCLSFSPSF